MVCAGPGEPPRSEVPVSREEGQRRPQPSRCDEAARNGRDSRAPAVHVTSRFIVIVDNTPVVYIFTEIYSNGKPVSCLFWTLGQVAAAEGEEEELARVHVSELQLLVGPLSYYMTTTIVYI